MKYIVLCCFFSLPFCVHSQSINLSTVNIGGGSASRGYYQIDWSIGEGASIATFQNAGNLIVTSGVLQPFTEKIGTTDLAIVSWAKDEIVVYPVPTPNILEVNFKITALGKITMQLLDQSGRVILTKKIDYVRTNGIQKMDLTAFSSGMYYLNIILSAPGNHSVIRKGTFKVQKL